MWMSGRGTSCCVTLVVTLTCVSAVQKLNSITDLKAIDFKKSVPKHSLILLHWFANEVEIDNNNVIRVNFDPNGDFGSHHYGNYECILQPLRRGYRYYTIGNLNHGTSVQLPDYVIHPQRGYNGENRDRIILSASQQMIGLVFITQHYGILEQRGTLYDPNHTYQITTNLLRQIREFSLRDNYRPLLHLRNRYQSNANTDDLKMIWGNLACLGLFLSIVIKEKHTPRQGNNRPSITNTPGSNNRPSFTNTPGSNNRPSFTNTPGSNNRPYFTNTPGSNNRPVVQEYNDRNDNNTRANNKCRICCISFICISVIIVGAVIAYIFFLK